MNSCYRLIHEDIKVPSVILPLISESSTDQVCLTFSVSFGDIFLFSCRCNHYTSRGISFLPISSTDARLFNVASSGAIRI